MESLFLVDLWLKFIVDFKSAFSFKAPYFTSLSVKIIFSATLSENFFYFQEILKYILTPNFILIGLNCLNK